MLIPKEIVRPGTYWYKDEKTGLPRRLDVTAELTKYWHEQGNKMLSVGLTVPVPKEHDFKIHPMTPADKLENNAGWVKEYQMRGDRLFGIVDVPNDDLAKKLPHTIRWTSPWISSFTDGDGRAWNNVITHLALTTRPRISTLKQDPFPSIAAALSIASTVKSEEASKDDGFCLSRAGLLVTVKKHLRPLYPMAFSLYGGIKLSEDMPPLKKKKDKKEGEDDYEEGGADLDADGVDDAAEVDGMGEGLESMGKMNPLVDSGGDVKMEELLCDLLAALGIPLPENVGEAEFKRALYEAAMTKIRELTSKAQSSLNGDTTNQPPTGQGNNLPPNPLIQQEQQPMYMSLEDINKIADPTMKSIALSMYNENVKLRAELDVTGKATASLRDAKLKEENSKRASRVAMLSKVSPKVKADLDAMLALPAMALSMGDGGAVIDPMAQMLAVLEKGLSDIPTLLRTDRAALDVLPQPTDEAALSLEEEDALAESQARRMGCPPQKKAG